MERIDSPGQSFVKGQIYWARVVSFDPASSPTIAFDGQRKLTVNVLAGYLAPQLPTPSMVGLTVQNQGPGNPLADELSAPIPRIPTLGAGGITQPWQRIDLTGTIAVEYSQNPFEPYPGPPAPLSAIATPATTGNVAALNDAVSVAVPGRQWATVQLVVNGAAGTVQVTTEYSIDGGTNWLPSAFAKLLSTVSANPTVQALASTTLATGQTWEIPIADNTTNFRVRAAVAGTATNVTVQGGTLYVPGIATHAILFDTTSGVGAAVTTPTLDIEGWLSIAAAAYANGAGAGVLQILPQFDDGTNTNAPNVALGGNGHSVIELGVGVGTASIAPAGGSYLALGCMIYRRAQFSVPIIAAQTNRLRVEANR